MDPTMEQDNPESEWKPSAVCLELQSKEDWIQFGCDHSHVINGQIHIGGDESAEDMILYTLTHETLELVFGRIIDDEEWKKRNKQCFVMPVMELVCEKCNERGTGDDSCTAFGCGVQTKESIEKLKKAMGEI